MSWIRRLPVIARAALLVVAAVAVFGIVLHAVALANHSAARNPSRALSDRRAAALRAVRLEPFNQRFRVTEAITRALVLVEGGDVDAAYFALLPLSTEVRNDALFTETYQEVNALKRPLDERKAHQQHAREKQGGRLEAEDVFK